MEPTETVVDNTEVADVEVSDTNVDAELNDAIENLSLDDLMNITEDDYEEFNEDAQHKGMQPLHSWMKHVPADVRKHIANIRSDYTRKTQELAQIRKDLESRTQDMHRQSESTLRGPLARQLKDIDTEVEYDLFDSEGMKSEIQRQAKLMLKDMLKPAQEELEVQQRRVQLSEFKAQNPEMTDPEYRSEIIKLIHDRPELKLEDAFYITKARLGATKVQQERAELNDRKQRQRSTMMKSSSGTRTAPSGTPKFSSAIEAFKYHKSMNDKK
jgi:phage-related minor tail protein